MTASNRAKKSDWLKFCRICLEWLHPRQDYTAESCEQWIVNVVERAQSMHINALEFDLYHGGHAVFNGSVAPKDRHLGEVDLYAILDRELHQRGMKFFLMHMATHCNSYQAYEYPQWLQRNADGTTRPAFPAPVPCLNTPWVNYFMQELRGLLSRYQIDGLYIEGLLQGPCYCDFCQTEFHKRYGYELPKDSAVVNTNKDYQQFNMDIINNYVRRVREVINEVSPKTRWIPCHHGHDAEGVYTDFATWGKYADAVELERPWGPERYEIPLRDIGMSMQLIAAESSRPPFGTVFLAWSVDCDYSHSTTSQHRLSCAEIMIYNGTPQLHAQTVFDLDQSEMDTVRELYSFEEKLRPYLLDAELISYAALVFERANFPGRWFKGYYRALLEAHIPFRVIWKENLTPKELSKHKVVLLPNITKLSDEQIETIKTFVTAGGGLVMTYQTGSCHADGTLRQKNPFLELAGCKGPFGITTYPTTHIRPEHQFELHALRHYLRVTEDSPIAKQWAGRLQSFKGSYVKVEPDGGTVIAKALDYDYTKSFHRHHPVMGWYPGEFHFPIAVANQSSGRVVYFAGELDAAAFRQGMPGQLELLADAVVWAAGEEPPVKVQAPITVEMATHYSPSEKTYTLFFVNHTMNQLERDWVVRHVQPIPNIKVDLQVGKDKAKEVISLTDVGINWRQQGGKVMVELSTLAEYEAIAIRL